MENNCKWLSDLFAYICCCGENKTYCSDACPFYRRPSSSECHYYEESESEPDYHDCVAFSVNGTCKGCICEDCCPYIEG